MFFGKSKKRKSNYVSSPEYNEYIETDNLQDALDLFERMKKHGFEPAGGMNKLRWIRGDDVFDFDKPFGPAVKAYDIPQTELDKLIALLDKLDEEDSGNEEPESTDADNINIADFEDEIKESDGNVEKIVDRIIDLSKTTDMSSDDIEYMRDVLTQKVKDYLDKKPENESTNLSSIAKSITQNDLGRSL